LINRHLVRDFLLDLSRSETMVLSGGRDVEAHYRWLADRIDPASTLESEFLAYLYENKLRLPDTAQHRLGPEMAAQPDFYYEREGVPGVCVFVDGPHHDTPEQTAHDRRVREALEDRGYRVITIRYDKSLAEQVAQHLDVFGAS
jgi:very-short-patch-repair endonuclease